MSRSFDDRLDDVLRAIERIRMADEQLTSARSANDLQGVAVAFDAVLHNLFVIGEAVKSIPVEALASEPTVPWRAIKGMRDFIGHAYHRIDPKVVHAAVREDLSQVESAIRRLRADASTE